MFTDWFVPKKHLLSDDEYFRAQSLVIIGFTGFLVLGSFIPFRLYYQGIGTYSLVLSAISGLCLATPFIQKFTSFRLASWLFIWPLGIGLLGLCFVDGGVLSPTLFALPIMPLVATFLLSNRQGIALTLIVGAVLFLLALYPVAPWIKPIELSEDVLNFFNAASSFGLAVCLVAIAYVFVSWQQKLRTGLVELNTAKDNFLSGMSHEMRTPLHSIMGFTELMKGGYLGKLTNQQDQNLEHVLKSAQHLANLVEDLLDMGRIESHQIALNKSEVNVGKITQDAILSLKRTEPQPTMSLDLDAAPLAWRVDETRYQQVILNLIGNALKFTPSDGLINIRLEASDTTFRTIIEDNGPGIPLSEQERVFDRFHQAKSSLGGKSEGSGLGLYIAKRLIELHSGTLEIDNTYTDGCRIVLSVPGS